MARVPYLTQDDLPEDVRHLLEERPINLRRAMVNIPRLAEHYAGIAEWFRFEGRVDPRLRELAILYVGYASASAYAFCQHVRIGTGHGVTDTDIRSVMAAVNGEGVEMAGIEGLVVEAARQLTGDVALEDAVWERLVDALGRDVAMELVLTIAHYNYVVRMLAGLRIDVESDWSAPLAVYEPPAAVGSWR